MNFCVTIRLCRVAVLLCGMVLGVVEQAHAAGDPVKGAKIFKRCVSCHTIAQGGRSGTGPNLWNIVGRDIASDEGYPRYSKAMKSQEGAWTTQRLDIYLASPRADVPGTNMNFIGLPKADQRRDLIAYLSQQGDPVSTPDTAVDDPKDAPEEVAQMVQGDPGAQPFLPSMEDPAASDEYGVLVTAGGVEETYAYCTPCHSERLVAQQGLSRDRWDELFEQMVDEHGMAEIETADREIILNYLTEHYGPDRPNFPVAP